MKANNQLLRKIFVLQGLILISGTAILTSCKKSVSSTVNPNAPINYNDYANGGVHLEIVNSDPSDYTDDQLYVSVIGGSPGANSQSVFIDLKTGKTVPMSDPSVAHIPNPNDPTGTGKVIAIGTKMSDIPVDPVTHRHSIPLPFINSARIRLSINKPLYWGVNAGGSFADPVKSTRPTDANYQTVFDFMEFTYYSTGSGARVFANTSRVDEYAISMGFELNALQGTTGTVQRAGELMNHKDIVQAFQSFSKPADYNQCYRSFFQDIVNPGGMTDASGNQIFTQTTTYAQFQTYIDAIWQTYKNQDLVVILGGNIGSTDSSLMIRGRVDSNNVFNFIQTQTTNGNMVVKKGTLPIKPTTSDVLGGNAGTQAFNNSSVDGTPGHELDNTMRVAFVAALNRHTIMTDAAVGQIQYLEDVSKFYKTAPYNYYAAFWHSPGVSYNNLQYAFSYDDVANQSSTIVGDNPAYCTLYFGPVPSN